VQFVQDDAYEMTQLKGPFDSGFAGFWWSHIPVSQLHSFLSLFHSKLLPGAKLVFIDNQFVKGNSTPIHRQDEDGNTYQIRRLRNGQEHEVLKNFPTDQQLNEILGPFSARIEIKRLQYYWLLEYQISSN
jgi:hypothetical protein